MTSEVNYQGQLRTICQHLKSGNKIVTDAPTDNNGNGQAFSPTDLVATALASCMLTIMGIKANQHQLDIIGTKASVTKVMASNPRRISKVIVEVVMPSNFDEATKKILENAARTCPVALSLNVDIMQEITFTYPQ